MKYNLFQLQAEVLLLDRTPAKIFNPETNVLIGFNVRDAFRKALSGNFTEDQPSQGNPGISFEKKMIRFRIAEKIWTAETEVELSTEEQSELKNCVGKMFNGEALGFLEKVLEGKYLQS